METRKRAAVEEEQHFSMRRGPCFRGEALAFNLGLPGLSEERVAEKRSQANKLL